MPDSVKFATDVTVTVTVTVTVSLRNGKVGCEIRVADNGPGIPEHVRARAFEPFFKGDEARPHGDAREGKEDFGLGLSIVADIVHAHRGAISLADNMPKGLISKITIPIHGDARTASEAK